MAYWALKTRRSKNSGSFPKDADKWKYFLGEDVIAIGWGKIKVSPDKASKNELLGALKSVYHNSDGQAIAAASIIRKFVEISEHDNILICQGYNFRQTKDVRLYGTACNIGSWRKCHINDWQCFKRKAKVEGFNGEAGIYIPKDILIEMLDGKKTFIGTLHKISKEQYERIVGWATNERKKRIN